LGIHATDLQKAKILERSNSLRRKIDAWVSIQQLYIPAVAPLRTQDDSTEVAPLAVQDIKLYLPSSLPRVTSGGTICNILFIRHEWDFRYAQAQESLNDLRGFLLLYSHMLKSKDRYIRGQRLHTRSVKLLSDVESKVQGSASKYRRIWAALEALSPMILLQTTWKKILRPLDTADVTGLSSMDDSRSEGRKKLSWIWKVHGTGANVDDCTEAGKSLKFMLLILILRLTAE
jgi:hypothetical protein